MRPIPLPLAVFSALLLAPAAAAAQEADTAEPGDGDRIVVTGRSEPVDQVEVTRQARAISRETDIRHEPLARFEDRACPGVTGLKREYAEMLVGRFRMIAEDLGIPTADEASCKPNIIVVFSEDGRADLADIQKRTKLISDSVTMPELRELTQQDGPVHVWSIVETRTASGMPVPRRRNLEQVPVVQQEGGQSLITTVTRQDIVGVAVLFDKRAVLGKSLHQLADYAVMRVYARTRDAEGEHAPDSILGLFDATNSAPPPGLTDFDRAYLAALYEGVPHIRAISKLGRVSEHLERIQEGEEE